MQDFFHQQYHNNFQDYATSRRSSQNTKNQGDEPEHLLGYTKP